MDLEGHFKFSFIAFDILQVQLLIIHLERERM